MGRKVLQLTRTPRVANDKEIKRMEGGKGRVNTTKVLAKQHLGRVMGRGELSLSWLFNKVNKTEYHAREENPFLTLVRRNLWLYEDCRTSDVKSRRLGANAVCCWTFLKGQKRQMTKTKFVHLRILVQFSTTLEFTLYR